MQQLLAICNFYAYLQLATCNDSVINNNHWVDVHVYMHHIVHRFGKDTWYRVNSKLLLLLLVVWMGYVRRT